jgi:DNA repair exonuclease SbcCD nuclease subunit
MTKPFIVLSDLHFYRNIRKSVPTDRSISSWLDMQFDVVAQVFEYAKENDVETVIINGDIFEEKNKIDVGIYNLVWDFFYSWSVYDCFHIVINTGNHDMFAHNRNSALKPFSTIATICRNPTKVNNDFLFLPYGYKQCDQTAKFLFTHAEICRHEQGIKYDGFDVDFLNQFEYVFNGHIHQADEFGNIVNVGSIIRQDFNEADEQKRFLHYANNKLRSVNIKCPNFITVDDLTSKMRKKIEKNTTDFFRISIDSSMANDPIFSKHNVSVHKIKEVERTTRIKQGIDKEEELKEYIKLKDPDKQYDWELLLKIGKILQENGE